LKRLSYRPVRALLLLAFGIAATGQAASVELDWAGLIPPTAHQAPLEKRDGSVAFGQVSHFDVTATPEISARIPWGAQPADPQDWTQPPSSGFRSDLDGVEVTIKGFITPLGFEGEQITEFLLVPYFGACVHVPPPPANQIVLVSDADGEMPDNLFDPVEVTGVLRVEVTAADFGEVGYRMEGAVYRPLTAP
jgi:hypothetical protein